MIEVEKAQRLQELPAGSKSELFKRLELNVGSVLKIEVPAREEKYDTGGYPGYGYSEPQNAYATVGELLWLKRTEGGPLRVKLRGSSKKLKLKLSYTVSMLADGQWIPLHIAKEKIDSELDSETDYEYSHRTI